MMDGGSHSGLSGPSATNESWSQQQQWMQEQELLKARLVLHDCFSWTLPEKSSQDETSNEMSNCKVEEGKRLQYIGGVDLSFPKDDSSYALGALVVLEMDSLKVVYEDFDMVQLEMPYIPGFLAFRESPVLLNLLEKMANKEKALFPQLLMVDGNGILHPRGFGLASQLGVLADLPTIGVAKNLHIVDGLLDKEVRMKASESNVNAGDTVPLIGKSGRVWGAVSPLGHGPQETMQALKSHEGSTKPIFISIGHRISLESAVDVTQRCCRHRIPEPVRQADIRSRKRLRLPGHHPLGCIS